MTIDEQIENLDSQIAALHKEADGYENQLRKSSLTTKQSISICDLMLKAINTAGTLIQIKQAIVANQPKPAILAPQNGLSKV